VKYVNRAVITWLYGQRPFLVTRICEFNSLSWRRGKPFICCL